MNSHSHWTVREELALKRNYAKYGVKVDDWDEPISRSENAISAKAIRMGVSYMPRHGTVLTDANLERLRYLASEICDRLGLTTRELAHEISLLADRERR